MSEDISACQGAKEALVTGGIFARTTVAFAATLMLTLAAHLAAPVASAECTGQGVLYEAAVKLADGAVVGALSKVGTDQLGIPYAAEVRVERAFRSQAGSVWRGKAYAARGCDGDVPSVGARAVVLLGVTVADGIPPSDFFYTVGLGVTEAQVARIAADLPDTATASRHAATQPLASILLAFLCFFVVLTVAFASQAFHVRRPIGRGGRSA